MVVGVRGGGSTETNNGSGRKAKSDSTYNEQELQGSPSQRHVLWVVLREHIEHITVVQQFLGQANHPVPYFGTAGFAWRGCCRVAGTCRRHRRRRRLQRICLSGAVLIDCSCVFERTMHVKDGVVRYMLRVGGSCRCCCCCCRGKQSIIIARLEELLEQAFRLGEGRGEDFFGAGNCNMEVSILSDNEWF